MAEQANNPLNQVTDPTEQFKRKTVKENKKYSKNTKLKVIQQNDVVGEHDAIMRRKSGYSCICEGYEGGVVQSIPKLIFLYIVDLDKKFHKSLKEKLNQKMIDFNDRVLKISQQMQKFGDFFFFKGRQPSEDNAYIKQNSVFEIDKSTKKIKKINISENQRKSYQDLEEIKEIKHIVNKIQQENGKEGDDHNDFNYFPVNELVHQKKYIQQTIPISSKDLEHDLWSESNLNQKKVGYQQNKNKIPSRQSFSNIPDIIDQNTQISSKQKLKLNKQLQNENQQLDNSLFHKLLEQDPQSSQGGKYISQRYISSIINEENSYNSFHNIEENKQTRISQIINIEAENESQSFHSQYDENIQQENKKQQKLEKRLSQSRSPTRSLSRKTIIINDEDLIEEENHQITSQSSSFSSEQSEVSPISQKKVNKSRKDLSNGVSIILEQDNKQDIGSFTSSTNQSPLFPDNYKRRNYRNQKKALTLTCEPFYQKNNKGSNDSLNLNNNVNIHKDDATSQIKDFDIDKQRGKFTLSVYQSRGSEQVLGGQSSFQRKMSQHSKMSSQSRIMDYDDIQNGSTPKNLTSSTIFSNKNSNQQKKQNSISINNKITDKLLQKAVENTQNLKNEILKEKDLISVTDLLSSNKNELKSLMEIRNLQKKMTQKQDPMKYDELLKTSSMRVLDINIKLNEQKNKVQLEEERQRKEEEINKINDQLKEQIIRRHMSKIGLASPANSVQLNKLQNSISPTHSESLDSMSGSGQLSSSSRNILRSTQMKSMSNKPLNDSINTINSQINTSIMSNKEFKRNKTKKMSLFNKEAAVQNTLDSSEAESTPQQKLNSNNSPINNDTLTISSLKDENLTTSRARNSFINYNYFAHSSTQRYEGNGQRKLLKKSQYADPLNIGLKHNKSMTPLGKQEFYQSFQNDKETLNSPHSQTIEQTKGKKSKIHFKSSVDEYLQLKAQALSNNFDKKKIKTKDLPFLDSYANQLQINLKRLFYVKLQENYGKDSGLENMQERVADQMLDPNFKQFLKKNKDILPEKKDLNYLYNWRKSHDQSKSIVDKIQQQFSTPKNKPISQQQQDFLKDNIPAQGFSFKKVKLPNLYEKHQTQGIESSINLTSPTHNHQQSMELEKQPQLVAKVDFMSNGSLTTKRDSSFNIKNQGREKILGDRAKMFQQNMNSIKVQQKKEQKNNKSIVSIFDQKQTNTQNTEQNFPKTIANIDLLKRVSYKDFQDIYKDNIEKIEDLQDKARNDLILLDKYFKNNQRADNALKNDNDLAKRLSSKTELEVVIRSNNLPQVNKFKRKGTLDSHKFEEDYLGLNDEQNKLISESENDQKEGQNAQKKLFLKANNTSFTQLKKFEYYTPNRKRVSQSYIKSFGQKTVTDMTVEEEMKELTDSIIQKYGLQSKFKNKNKR